MPFHAASGRDGEKCDALRFCVLHVSSAVLLVVCCMLHDIVGVALDMLHCLLMCHHVLSRDLLPVRVFHLFSRADGSVLHAS